MPDVRAVPVPKKMRALARDGRGYPVPFNIFRDTDGRPHYTINDSDRRDRCIREGRCAICGTRLDKLMWLVGGPQSAFDPNGAYIDTALHHECMVYALQVCPYLALAGYLKRIDGGTLNPAKVPDDMVFVDPTMLPHRPALFVGVATRRIGLSERGYLLPERPYAAVEYWQNGVRLTEAEAQPLL